MTEQTTESLEQLGPVKSLIVEFPRSRFRDDIAPTDLREDRRERRGF